MQYIIIEITRGHILLSINNKIVNIQGEGLLHEKGAADYVIYSDSIKRWEPPYNCEEINIDEKESITKPPKGEIEKRDINHGN
jgi:hypothetical protein